MKLLLSLLLSSLALDSFAKECGYHVFDKIYDGEYSAIDEFPWLARLMYVHRNKTFAGYFCAGTLIDKRFVLTAAHCITHLREKGLYLHGVRLGEYNTNTTKDCVSFMGFEDCADPAMDLNIDFFMTHPNFTSYSNDVAIIKLSKDVETTDFVRPICLPKDQNFKIGDKMVVAGWGSTESHDYSTIKLKVEVPVVSFWRCYNKYISRRTILNPRQHICAGGDGKKDSCTGDSGGPLMSAAGDGRWKIIGITSSGNKCGVEGWPAIYTRVESYVEWIYEFLNNS